MCVCTTLRDSCKITKHLFMNVEFHFALQLPVCVGWNFESILSFIISGQKYGYSSFVVVGTCLKLHLRR